MSWAEGRMTGLDTESTGTDATTERIVTAAIVHTAPGQRPRTINWLMHPGRDVPDEAAAVHGWTLDRIEATLRGHQAIRWTDTEAPVGRPKETALFEIAAQAATVMGCDSPLVVHNAAYDMTLLEAELIRNDVPTLSSRPAGIRGLIDPMVIEKQWDTYRKVCYKSPGCDAQAKVHECGGCRGSKKFDCGGCGATDKTLTSLCQHYGIRMVGAHDAAADALGALRLAVRLAGLWRQAGGYKLETLHRHQSGWARSQRDGLREFWEKVGDERAAEVDSGWPLADKFDRTLVTREQVSAR